MVAAGDEGLRQRALAAAIEGDALVLWDGVDVGVGAHLLDRFDRERKAVGVGRELHILGANADDRRRAETRELSAVDLEGVGAELDAVLGDRHGDEVHRGP